MATPEQQADALIEAYFNLVKAIPGVTYEISVNAAKTAYNIKYNAPVSAAVVNAIQQSVVTGFQVVAVLRPVGYVCSSELQTKSDPSPPVPPIASVNVSFNYRYPVV
jgi:hypothetical protein